MFNMKDITSSDNEYTSYNDNEIQMSHSVALNKEGVGKILIGNFNGEDEQATQARGNVESTALKNPSEEFFEE